MALVSRVPVRRWHVLPLGAGRARLPLRAPDPQTGRARWWWVPDEPRVALAALVDGLTVVATHLSFSPPTALRQARRLGAWASTLPEHVVVAGDLNLPGPVPAAVLGGRRLVRAATYPATAPRVQLDHVVAAAAVQGAGASVRRLRVGDHLASVVTVRVAV